MWSQIWIKEPHDQKTFIGDSMPSKSRVRGAWRGPFPVWAREFPFLCKGALDKKVQWTACQKRRGFRFDRRLLVFHPRSLTGKRREDCCSSGRTPRTPALHEEATPPSSPGKETRPDPTRRGKHPLHSAGLLRAARSASTSERRWTTSPWLLMTCYQVFLYKVIPLLSFVGSIILTSLIKKKKKVLVPFICTLFLRQFCALSALFYHSPVK